MRCPWQQSTEEAKAVVITLILEMTTEFAFPDAWLRRKCSFCGKMGQFLKGFYRVVFFISVGCGIPIGLKNGNFHFVEFKNISRLMNPNESRWEGNGNNSESESGYEAE